MSNQKVLRVFIIDDNETTRTVLRMILTSERFLVVGEATNGTVGMERAEKLQPDIICLDIDMPGLDGLDVLTKLPNLLPKAVVFMVTASNDKEVLQNARDRGAVGIIQKPFSTASVVDTIREVMSKIS